MSEATGGVESDLERAVAAVVGGCLAVAAEEELLVICNASTRRMAEAMCEQAARDGAEAVLCEIAERSSHGAEPPASVAAAMAAADAVLAPTVQSLSHTAARRQATEAGVRIATLPGVNEQMLARVMSADMEGLRRRGKGLADRMTAADEARITCPRGSDLRVGLEGREAIPDAGELGRRGAFGNLPCGEGFIAPLEGSTTGELTVDGSIAGIGMVSEPVRLRIEEGHLVEASGEEGRRLMELLTAHGPEGTNVAELGVGTNERATLTGNILEDEKILGTCHVAFGASAAIGGTVQVPVHLDCVALRAEVTIGDETVASEGELLVG